MPFDKLLWTLRTTKVGSPSVSIADFAVYTYILLIGAFGLTHYIRTPDLWVDATYPDLARSILDQGSYQIRFLPQATLPPGFPLILALVGRFVGLSQGVLFRVIVVSAALGLIAAYELLRRVEGRGLAAASCLLFACSPALFSFNTTCVFPEMPFFLGSMFALLLALRVDHSEPGRALIGWELLLGFVLSLTVLIRSVGIALLVGLVTWSVTSLLLAPEVGRRRIRRFSIPLVLGLAAQLGWSAWSHRHQTLEWQLPGYPESYISQLKVKDGQEPELGLAHLTDLPGRVGRNLVMRTVSLGQMLTRRHVSLFWPSPAISGVIILIVTGLAFSLRNGGQLHDWYFLWYETIFLFWPWETRDRFLFPVVPLACLYLWRGVKAFKSNSIHHPKTVGLCIAVAGSFLSLSSATFAFRIATFSVDPQHMVSDRLQPFAATLFWGALAVGGLGTFLFYSRRDSQGGGARALAPFSRIVESKAPLPLRCIAILTVAILVGSGTEQIMARGRDNLNPDVSAQALYPEIEAAEWIRTHEPLDRVLMAREPEFVFHYTQRRVVWFPPISDPRVLMDGIRRFHVDVVVVAHHPDSYWRPPEDACFQSLLHAYGNAFLLSHQGPDYWIFDVVAPQGRP